MSMATLEKAKNRRRNGALLLPDPPPLLNGDRLTVPEFERRYGAMPEIKKAELIEGIVVMSPPVSNVHAETHGMLGAYLRRSARATPGVSLGLNASVRLDGKNEYQPDALLRIQSGKLGGSKVGPDGLLDGAPEFVAEIAVSSAGSPLISTGLQPGESDHEGTSAASAASSARGKTAKAAPHLPRTCHTALKRGANERKTQRRKVSSCLCAAVPLH